MVLIHLREALQRVRFGGEMFSQMVYMMTWHLSGLTLIPYLWKKPVEMRLKYVLKDFGIMGCRYDGGVVDVEGVEKSAVIGGFRFVDV